MRHHDTPSPLARSTDPITSHRAAAKVEAFAGSHRDRIMHALADGPLSTRAISDASGLTVEQVDRRMHELRRDGQVWIVGEDGRYTVYAVRGGVSE